MEEGGSIAFSVQGAEVQEEVSDDEEEERQRKEELHQLLTEQLQDDLLDDSVSTVTTEDGAADSTLLGEEMGVALDHVISPNKSCDLTPITTEHKASGEENDGLSAESVLLEDQSGRDLGGCGLSGCGQPEVSDVFSGTAQAYSLINSISETRIPAALRTGHTHQEMTSSSDGRGQLEVLYGARCRQVGELTQHLQESRDESEKMERILRHEKREVEERWRAEKEELVSEVERVSQQLRETSAALTAARAEREEVCAMLHPPTDSGPGDVARRLIEASAEKEDLQYQLSCCQGQLETQIRKAESAEDELLRMSSQLLSLETEVERLGSEVVRLETEGERERERLAAEKREALQKCRAACLQLHEDATERLREAMAAEKDTLFLKHRQQLTALQAQLSSVQEEYVKVCREKDRMEAEHKNNMEQAQKEWQARTEQLLQSSREEKGELERVREVRQAVEKAREEWRQTLAQESRQSVEKALCSARHQWQARTEQLLQSSREEKGEMERVREVRQAVEKAREEWRQTLAQESRQSVEKALCSARHQWQARLAAEKEAVRRQVEKEREAAVRAAVEAARSQWQTQHQHSLQVAVEEAKKQKESVLTAAEVHSMIQTTVAAVKKDVRQMLEEVVRVGRERQQQAVAQCRLATAQEMKAHYLSCLHMMVNSHPPSGPSSSGEPIVPITGEDVGGNRVRRHGNTGQRSSQTGVVGNNKNKRVAGSVRGGRGGGKRVGGGMQGQRSWK